MRIARHFRTIAEMQSDEAATTRWKYRRAGLEAFIAGGSNRCLKSFWRTGYAAIALPVVESAVLEKLFRGGGRGFLYTANGFRHGADGGSSGNGGNRGRRGKSMIHINRIAPIYPLTEGLPQRLLQVADLADAESAGGVTFASRG